LLVLLPLWCNAQIDEIIEEQWYLRSLRIDGVLYFPPYDAGTILDFSSIDLSNNVSGTGVSNIFIGDAIFDIPNSKVTFSNLVFSDESCTNQDCEFEQLLFNEFLTDQNGGSKTFSYEYVDLTSFINKRLRLIDDEGSIADYVFNPIHQPSEDLFQQWYLYSSTEDLGETTFYEGENVPKLLINENLSFYGENNCWEYEGVFEYVSIDLDDLPHLKATEFNQECIGENTDNIFEFLLQPNGEIRVTNDNETLYLELVPGYLYTFRNSLTLNIPKSEVLDLDIYPNPTSSQIFIDYKGLINKVEVFTITGALLQSETFNVSTFDLSNYRAGMYFLKLYLDNSTQTIKVIKK